MEYTYDGTVRTNTHANVDLYTKLRSCQSIIKQITYMVPSTRAKEICEICSISAATSWTVVTAPSSSNSPTQCPLGVRANLKARASVGLRADLEMDQYSHNGTNTTKTKKTKGGNFLGENRSHSESSNSEEFHPR